MAARAEEIEARAVAEKNRRVERSSIRGREISEMNLVRWVKWWWADLAGVGCRALRPSSPLAPAVVRATFKPSCCSLSRHHNGPHKSGEVEWWGP
jgi:hypothetical protein